MTDLSSLSADEVRKFIGENLPPGFGAKQEKPQRGPQIHVCLAILSYDARVYTRTMTCIMQAIMSCAMNGWGVSYILREADSMVARGRSFLASQFIENPAFAKCTHLAFIDCDLTWDKDEFVRLISHPVDVVGGAYPFKDESGDFPLQWKPSSGLEEQYGLWIVQSVTPGFFRVTREALVKIAREMPWLEYKDRANPEGQRSWMFFDNIHRPNGIFDEGYIFCERWRTVGGTVYLDPDLNLTHIGMKAYNHGSIREWMDKRASAVDRLISEYPGVPDLILVDKLMGRDVDLKAEAEKAAAEKTTSGEAA